MDSSEASGKQSVSQDVGLIIFIESLLVAGITLVLSDGDASLCKSSTLFCSHAGTLLGKDTWRGS